jgi:hypothetical protein
MRWIEHYGIFTAIVLSLVLLGGFGVLVQYQIFNNYFVKPQPKIVCQGGYQVLVSKDKEKEPIFLIDKNDKKIPCR